MRLTQQRHDSYLRRGETKAKVKASFKESGIKDSCAFSKLEYFDVVDGYQLDGMHIFSNVVALHHNALLGGGFYFLLNQKDSLLAVFDKTADFFGDIDDEAD